MRRTMLASAGILGMVSLMAVTGVSAMSPQPTDPSVAMMAQMAERNFPSGTQAVVLVAGNAPPADWMAASALAAHLNGAVLATPNPAQLGPTVNEALSQMTIPAVSQTTQPFQPPAGKPAVYAIGLTSTVVATLQAEGYTVTALNNLAPNDLLTAVNRWVAPPVPSQMAGFPSSWTSYAGGPTHNAVFPAPPGAPLWETAGVHWQTPEMAAVPFSANYPDLLNLGERSAPVKMTQDLGNAVGVTAVNGIIYAESDDYHLYAMDARTGQVLWTAGPTVNALMGNPLVADGLVFVSAGDTGFPFSQLLKYDLSGGTAPLVRGLGYAALYAFNAQTGRLVWRQDFHGNAMATPIVVGNTVYQPTGGGNLWAMSATTGHVLWKTNLGGFDSMSSPNYWYNPETHTGEVIVGTSDANHVVAVNAATGQIVWTQPTNLAIFNTGMGDNSPTVDPQNGIVIQDSVVDFNHADGTCNLAVYAMNAATGQMLWSTDLGRGAAPPAYKAGVAMVANGVVYVGSPVTSTFYALNESTGQVLWSFAIPKAGPAGAGRGNAVLADGVLWLAAGPSIYALNPATGQEISQYTPGGRFGIVNPVIVGHTMYLDNSYDWVQAIPLTLIDPHLG